jgi:hypothetical protein
MSATPQQIIDTGAVNDGTGESLRVAFTEVNNNFANVWAAGPVNSQVQISNNRITTNETNLDLVLAANGVGNVALSSTLVPRIDSVYDVGSPTRYFDSTYSRYYFGNGAFLTGITTSSNSISSGNSNVSIDTPDGPVTVGVGGVANVVVFASSDITIAANLLPSNAEISLGSNTDPFKDGWFSGNSLHVGNATISANATALILTNAQGGEFVIDTTGTDYPYNDSNVVTLLDNLTSNISTTGNVTAQNFIGNVIGNISGNINVQGSNTEVLFNDSGSANGSPALTFNKASNALAVTGTVSATGNITGSYIFGNGTALTGVLADRGSDTNNWDTLTQMGVYTVNRASWAGTVGTPLDSMIFVGLLEVKNSMNMALEQVFYPGTIEGGNVKIQWNRAYWTGSGWTAWIKIVNDDQVVTGGTY